MTTLGVFRDDFYPITNVLPQTTYSASTANLDTTTLSAASLVGAKQVYFKVSGQTAAQGVTTPTAANIIAQLQSAIITAANAATVPVVNSAAWVFRFWNANTSSGAVTLTAGTGVTITGTNTIAIGVTRSFLVTITGLNTVTLQDLGGNATT